MIMLRLTVFYKIHLLLASFLPWLLAAFTLPVVRLPRSLLVECNVIGHDWCPKIPITDCYENLKSALINRPTSSWVGYLQMGYVQAQWSVSCSESWRLKLVREIWVASFSDFLLLLQFVPVIGSRELEGKAAKVEIGSGGDLWNIPDGECATGGCCNGDLVWYICTEDECASRDTGVQRKKPKTIWGSWMGYLQMGYVQVQWSVSCSNSWCLKLVREIWVSSLSDFLLLLQFVPVIGSRELEGKAAKWGIGFGGDQWNIPAGACAPGGCCYGDQWAKAGLYLAKTYR